MNYNSTLPNGRVPSDFNYLLQQYGQTNQQQAYQPRTQPAKTGQYIYVNDFNEVVNAQVPLSGDAILFIGEGIMWSKKFLNGQPYISAFNFAPVSHVNEPTTVVNPQPIQEVTPEVKPLEEAKNDPLEPLFNNIQRSLDSINGKMGNFDNRLKEIENNDKQGKTSSGYDKKPTTSTTNASPTNSK